MVHAHCAAPLPGPSAHPARPTAGICRPEPPLPEQRRPGALPAPRTLGPAVQVPTLVLEGSRLLTAALPRPLGTGRWPLSAAAGRRAARGLSRFISASPRYPLVSFTYLSVISQGVLFSVYTCRCRKVFTCSPLVP